MAISGFLGGAVGGTAVNIIIRAVDAYSKEFRKLDKNLGKQESALKRLGRFLHQTGLGYAVLAGAAVGFGVSSVKAALESERAMQQFNLTLGETAQTMLKDLREASQRMASDFALVNAANRALALGIDRNQLPELMQAATARSKVFGRTVEQAFDDITIGIGRQSRMILDNLGIILNLDETYAKFADQIGKTSDSLSEYERKQALTNEIIEKSQGLIRAQMYLEDTHSEKLQRLGAMWANLKERVGAFLIDTYDLVTAVKQANPEIEKQASNLKQLSDELQRVNQEHEALRKSIEDITNVKLVGESERLRDLAKLNEEITRRRLQALDTTSDKEKKRIEEGLEGLYQIRDKLELEQQLAEQTKESAQSELKYEDAIQAKLELTMKAFNEMVELKKKGLREIGDLQVDLNQKMQTTINLLEREEELLRRRTALAAPMRRTVTGMGLYSNDVADALQEKLRLG
jgi:hypothetical protein